MANIDETKLGDADLDPILEAADQVSLPAADMRCFFSSRILTLSRSEIVPRLDWSTLQVVSHYCLVTQSATFWQ